MSSTPSRNARARRALGISRSDARGTGKSLRHGRPRDVERGRRGRQSVLEASTGNVYLDLGFSPAEAEYLALRSRLMLMLERLITDRKLTQAEAGRLLGVSQPRVSDIVRGRIERFTIDALVEMLARAGVRLDIVILPASA